MCEYIGGHSISFFLVYLFIYYYLKKEKKKKKKKKKSIMAMARDVLCCEQCIIFAKTIGKHVLT